MDVRAPSCTVHRRRTSIHYSLEKPTYFPTKFSSTELFPALCPPTTAICGRSRFAFCPMAVKASCMRFTRGIKSSIPRFPIFAAREDDGLASLTEQGRIYGFIFLCAPPRLPQSVQRAFKSARTHRLTSRSASSFTVLFGVSDHLNPAVSPTLSSPSTAGGEEEKDELLYFTRRFLQYSTPTARW